MTDWFHLEAGADRLHSLSSLGLAHLGDGVYELMVRSYLCLNGKATNHGLHKATVAFVAAPAQAAALKKIWDKLAPEEQDVCRRGRNASPHSVPPHASREEYAAATALEALFGWLYLQGRTDRLNTLFDCITEDG